MFRKYKFWQESSELTKFYSRESCWYHFFLFTTTSFKLKFPCYVSKIAQSLRNALESVRERVLRGRECLSERVAFCQRLHTCAWSSREKTSPIAQLIFFLHVSAHLYSNSFFFLSPLSLYACLPRRMLPSAYSIFFLYATHMYMVYKLHA